MLPNQQQAQLVKVLEGEPPAGGRWSGPKVGLLTSELLGPPVSPKREWESLRGLEYKIEVSRPSHALASELEHEKWKKTPTATSRIRNQTR
ncbi:MAG: hypothetical protein O4861_06640 [Trichodesmium sp. St16_bin4-tuft]|nr:hypothetical protein [Trichodesmium sp. St5_bin8]MDE5078033.1 hypothetical protein [Trichodesmium sp. St2_bin6]MDE5090319.1 hypothetical protein [Trichodesmium sp. St18_bin3_1_1]MDE5098026.1 hypothetical protein [Trichodesmium sp. St16_bin4-tuft]MDE5102405.1 hypothetical protein [Trichodesmium sp. St19_bin2]